MNLAVFKKPSRYIGNEINSVKKEADLRVALCFPDTYEVGMSHLGLKILYRIINNIPFACAERVFAPWIDLEAYLTRNDLPLTSLEHRRPLRDFDIIGFTLQYELSYTNILNILRLGRIPLRSDERQDDDPVVIAGGPCAVNPLPLYPFIDAFVMGDGEEVIKEIVSICHDLKGGDRHSLLKEFSKREGIYVPLIHDIKKVKIRRRIIHDLDSAPFPESPVVPYAPIVHDRIAIEISRGCTRGCRFCQAGMIYRPLRERTVERILDLSQKSLSSTGYDEISFTSLSTGDYTHLHALIKGFNNLYSDRCIAVSLPSLRVGSINRELLREIKRVRKTGFTIAPEAGTPRLRNIINKDFTQDEYEETLRFLFEEGWRHIKLYFMMGLPAETEADLNGIVNMVRMASSMGRMISGRGVNINVAVSAFVPKPHTPFQWTGQTSFEELSRRQEYLKVKLCKRGINFKGHNLNQSLLEAVFSRGDEKTFALLEEAYSRGCRFDGWSEFFDFDRWLRAAENTGIDLFEYASRFFDLDEGLPWDFIDTGIKKDALKNEYKRAMKGETTEDCRKACYGCGLGCREIRAVEEQEFKITEIKKKASPVIRAPHPSMTTRFRVRYSKRGILRYLSHQELMTAILRAIRRAGIPLVYSSGFHPHPVVSFGPALPVGVEGANEYFDIEVYPVVGPDRFMHSLNLELPEGIEVSEVIRISRKVRALSDIINCYEYEVMVKDDIREAVKEFMSRSEFTVIRKGERVNIRGLVKEAEVKDNVLRLVLVDRDGMRARLFEALQALLSRPLEDIMNLQIKRTGLYSYNKKEGVKIWQAR